MTKIKNKPIDSKHYMPHRHRGLTPIYVTQDPPPSLPPEIQKEDKEEYLMKARNKVNIPITED